MKRLILAGGSLVIIVLIAGAARQMADAQPFSRSRWIAENIGRLRFSGGVMPAGAAAIGRSGFIESIRADPGTFPNFRVSHDIVPGPHGSGEAETQAEPFVAINPSNLSNLLAGYQDIRFEDGGARALTAAYSIDGGRKWKETMLPKLTKVTGGPYDRASDPWVAFGPDNRAYYVSIAFNETSPRNGVYVNASTNGGKTFGNPVAVHVNETSSAFDDKESMVVDSGDQSPYRGYVYVGWDDAGTGIEYVSRSRDNGRSYEEPVALDTAGNNIGIVMVVASDGTVYAFWNRFLGTEYAVVWAKSEDGGAIWGTPAKVADIRAAGVPDLRTGDGLPMAAIDQESGSLYVVWQDARFTNGVDQAVICRSTNGGRTWSAPKKVSDGPTDAPSFTPAVAVTRDGKVGVAYYSMRNDPTRQYLVDHYLAVSSDRGKTFAPSIRVSKATFDVRDAAIARGYFLGDYQGIAGGNTVFHPFFIATLKKSAVDSTTKQPDAFASRVTP